MKVIGVIPARYGSTRFPGKALALLQGKPLVQWVWEKACRAKTLSRVIIATDDVRIKKSAEQFGAEVVMTKKNHPSGTDRIAEVVKNLTCDLVVNIQGDEPFLQPALIDQAVKALAERSEFHMSTLCQVLKEKQEIDSPHLVKVVFGKKNQALYFSRCPIPFDRDQEKEVSYYQHIGLYVYRKKVLLELVKLPISSLEKSEKLEQLRALENGYHILVKKVSYPGIGIDTPQDLEKAKRLLTSLKK